MQELLVTPEYETLSRTNNLGTNADRTRYGAKYRATERQHEMGSHRDLTGHASLPVITSWFVHRVFSSMFMVALQCHTADEQ